MLLLIQSKGATRIQKDKAPSDDHSSAVINKNQVTAY